MIIPHLNSTCCDHGTSISPSRMCASNLLPDLSQPIQYHDQRPRWSQKRCNHDPHHCVPGVPTLSASCRVHSIPIHPPR